MSGANFEQIAFLEMPMCLLARIAKIKVKLQNLESAHERCTDTRVREVIEIRIEQCMLRLRRGQFKMRSSNVLEFLASLSSYDRKTLAMTFNRRPKK